jgi:hypothetical protein
MRLNGSGANSVQKPARAVAQLRQSRWKCNTCSRLLWRSRTTWLHNDVLPPALFPSTEQRYGRLMVIDAQAGNVGRFRNEESCLPTFHWSASRRSLPESRSKK